MAHRDPRACLQAALLAWWDLLMPWEPPWGVYVGPLTLSFASLTWIGFSSVKFKCVFLDIVWPLLSQVPRTQQEVTGSVLLSPSGHRRAPRTSLSPRELHLVSVLLVHTQLPFKLNCFKYNA